MNKIYDRYEDLHVRNTYIYVKPDDVYAYADSAKTVKIEAAALKNLFLKGAIIVDGTIEYAPISFDILEGVGTIVYVKTNTAPGGYPFIALKSKEYT